MLSRRIGPGRSFQFVLVSLAMVFALLPASAASATGATGVIGDRVWEDAFPFNHVQDPGELGVARVRVSLRTCEGALVASTRTNNTGFYQFSGLAAGCYQVEFLKGSLPAGFAFVPPDGPDEATDSDADPATGLTEPIHLGEGEINLDVDAGLCDTAEKSSLGDRVWLDDDADGIQDTGEAGVEGVTVNLFEIIDGVPSLLSSDVTDAAGNYLFADLPAGFYEVEFVAPGGLEFTVSNAGSDDGVDSDASPADGRTGSILLPPRTEDLTWDAGLTADTPVAGLGDFVFDDLDGDGIQDPGEPGIPGVTVTLLDCAGNVVDTTATDGTGFYAFTGLVPGCYQVAFETPAGYSPSPANQGGDDTVDSDPVGGVTGPITLVSGQDDPTNDAGFVPDDPGIDIEKLTNGNQADGADDADVPQIAPGDTVTWTYLVTNTGNVPFSEAEVTVTDDQGVVPVLDPASDAGGDGVLSPGETWTYQATATAPVLEFGNPSLGTIVAGCNPDGTSIPGDRATYENIGQVTVPGGSDTDPSHYCNPPGAGVDIEKLVQVLSDSSGDACETYGKPVAITFEYQPGTTVSTNQDPGKATAEGVADDDDTAYIDAGDLFQGTVSVGDTFVLVGDFGGDTVIEVYDSQGGPLLQTIEFHTSCSQPITVGDIMGSAVIVGFIGEDGSVMISDPVDADTPTGPEATIGSPIEFTYYVTNTGDTILDPVEVIDDNGTTDTADDFSPTFVGGDDGDGLLEPGEVWVYSSMSTAIFGQYRNDAVVVGTPVDEAGNVLGPDVTDTDPAHYLGVLPQGDLCDLYDNPQVLVFELTGASLGATDGNDQDPGKVELNPDPSVELFGEVWVVAGNKNLAEDDPDEIYFRGAVTVGDLFTLDSTNAGKDKVSNPLFITVYSANPADGGTIIQTIEIHTSCSQPIRLGDTYGPVTLQGFYDKEGNGDGFPPTPIPPTSVGVCEVYDKPVQLTFEYEPGSIVSTLQDPSKAFVTGSPDDDAEAYIVVASTDNLRDVRRLKSDRIYFNGTVNAGETFVADAGNLGKDDFESGTWIFVFESQAAFQGGAQPLQSMAYHTSCSQPIFLGDVIGSVHLVGYLGKEGSLDL